MMQKRLQPRIDDHCLPVIRNASVCVVGFADQVGIEFFNLRDTPVVRAEAEQIDLVWPAHTPLGSNPRYVVTSLRNAAWDARALYKDLYCARGEAENRIGEQFELFADRASCETMAGNQLRLMFSSFAYVLMEALRRIALRHTQFADAAVNTIRLKLLKIGAPWYAPVSAASTSPWPRPLPTRP